MRTRPQLWTCLLAACVAASGCTTFSQWVKNGFKVGPNYATPPAPLTPAWTDANDERLQNCRADLCDWWRHFNDPLLDELIEAAYWQNLDLQKAAFRVQEATHGRNRARGNLLPQSQMSTGGHMHGQISENLTQGAFPQVFNLWFDGLAASWEIDFWGHYRRELEAANANLEAAQEAYRDVLVTLLGEVASNYIRLRSAQQRLTYAERNVQIQKGTLESARRRFEAGKAPEMDVLQARVNLAQTEASIPPLLTAMWEANYRLCVLLGEPAQEMPRLMTCAGMPLPPLEAAVGIPADLLRRRPDIRRAEREAAAQCAKIGVAEAEFYPACSIAGFLGYSSSHFSSLFQSSSFTGFVVPNYSWKILNYGRLMNNLRAEDARFRQAVLAYQQQVLRAGEEVECALVAFLQAQDQVAALAEGVQAADRFAELVLGQYTEGAVDFNRVYSAQETLVRQQDRLAVAQQDVSLNLIRVYRALGGGWESFQHCPKPGPRRMPACPSRLEPAGDEEQGPLGCRPGKPGVQRSAITSRT